MSVFVATNNSLTTITCSDPVNGTYATDVQVTTTNVRSAICSRHNVQSVPSGTLITVRSSNAANIDARAAEFAGLAATGALDRHTDGDSPQHAEADPHGGCHHLPDTDKDPGVHSKAVARHFHKTDTDGRPTHCQSNSTRSKHTPPQHRLVQRDERQPCGDP
ncbi:MAG: hypothetical protein J2P17_24745, partial [Mycobacterium sp.]|nr:hypothetical protein [Mycobacterium sp.]